VNSAIPTTVYQCCHHGQECTSGRPHFMQVAESCHHRGVIASSLGSYNKCKLSTKLLPNLKPSQSTWAVSPPVQSTPNITNSPYIGITQPRPTEGRRLSWPRWLTGGLHAHSGHPSK